MINFEISIFTVQTRANNLKLIKVPDSIILALFSAVLALSSQSTNECKGTYEW